MKRPLQGLRVLVTRARVQASDLTQRLETCGALPVVLPSIEFGFLEGEDQRTLDDAIRNAEDYDAVVLTSVRGVTAVVNRLEVLGTHISEIFSSRQIIAVGNVTAAAIEKAIRKPDLVPLEFSATGILNAIDKVEGKRFLLLRADLAKQDLPEGLAEAGAIADDVVAYRIVKSTETGSDVLAGPAPDIITFTSSSGVHNTHDRLVQAGREAWMEQVPIAVIGPVTGNTVVELGYEVAITAKEATIAGLIDALIQFCQNKEMSHA